MSNRSICDWNFTLLLEQKLDTLLPNICRWYLKKCSLINCDLYRAILSIRQNHINGLSLVVQKYLKSIYLSIFINISGAHVCWFEPLVRNSPIFYEGRCIVSNSKHTCTNLLPGYHVQKHKCKLKVKFYLFFETFSVIVCLLNDCSVPSGNCHVLEYTM